MARVTFLGEVGKTYYVAVDGHNQGAGAADGVIRLGLSDFGKGGADLPPGALGMLDFVSATYVWGSTEYIITDVIDHPEYVIPGIGLYIVGYELSPPYADQVSPEIIGTPFKNFILAGDWTILIDMYCLDYMQPMNLVSSVNNWEMTYWLEYNWYDGDQSGYYLIEEIGEPPPGLWREVWANFGGSGAMASSNVSVALTRDDSRIAVSFSLTDFPGSLEDNTTPTGGTTPRPWRQADHVYISGQQGPADIKWIGSAEHIRRIIFYPKMSGAQADALCDAMPPSLTPPPNDNFADAIELQLNVHVTGHNLLSTKEPGEPNHAGFASSKTVWYKFVAPATRTYTVLIGEGSGVFGDFYGCGPAVAVYTGSAVNALTLIEQGDSWPGLDLPFEAVAGTTYRIAVCSASNVATRPDASPFKIGIEEAVAVTPP